MDAVPPDALAMTGAVETKEARMQLSARNQLNATVATVNHGEVMSTVKVTLPDGQSVTAAITKDAAEDLGFAPGDAVVVVIKST
jgi:molybdate transport system regulatory protein